MQGQHLRWSYLSTVITAGLQLLSAVTLTRYLRPKDYGLAALALVSTNMMGYFTQLGVGRAIVQMRSVTEANIRAAFTLSMLTGLLGLSVLCVLAPLIAGWMHDTSLGFIIRIFAFNLLFQAAALVSGGLLRRALRMRALALCDTIAYAVSTFGICLPMAIHGYAVWALVASTVSQSIMQCICYFVARPHSVRPVFTTSAYIGVAAFSGKSTLTTAIEASGSSIDTALIGRLLGASAVGVYGRSLTLSTQPCYQFSMGLTRVFAPALAETMRASDRAAIVTAVLHAERQLMSVIFPLCVSAAICAPSVVPLILGRQWLPAVPIYQALCVVAAFDSSFDIPALQMEIANQFKAKVWLQSAFVLVFSAAILLAAPREGLAGVAVVYAALQAVRSIIFHLISARSLDVAPELLLASWCPGLLCSAAVATAMAAVQHIIPGLTPSEQAGKALALACTAFLVACAFYAVAARETVFQGWAEVLLGSARSPTHIILPARVDQEQQGSTCAL